MSKGFLTIAQNGQYDYVKMAYVLAMSLKISQEKYNNLSVIVNKDEEIDEKYLKLFDNVIYVDKPDTDWKIENKWRYYELTPYDETIVLDCDMLFFNDISSWWESLEDKTLEFTTKTTNYRGNIITSTYYRKTFVSNNLPNIHTALFYFKKTEENKQFFRYVQSVFENWKDFFGLLKDAPKFLSGDVVYALGAKVWFNRKWDNFLCFTHMRSRLQGDDIFDDWNKVLPTFFTNYNSRPELKVNNFNQFYPFHYIQKDFINDEVIEFYEDALRLL